ncbi:hypothetical protein LTR62_002417 [Meristemomyces frigidus]|uniref:NTF2-like domain-containing protein n=1 Tax=Meristemomyces frigidus TaxID=1508187 RepID=A0AAN7TGT8_9PEZI|nr:hypothetical protein LTR62_002417 [Meristemomyces frigidus]
MRGSTFIAGALAFLTTTIASPVQDRAYCIGQWEAQEIVNKIISIFGHQPGANATAEALLADDFTEHSDSIHALEGQPLTGASTTANKQEWIKGMLGEPPTLNITTLYVGATGCNKIIWYWQFNSVARATYRVRGFNLFTLNSQCQIQELDLEFNSIAWGLDDGELQCGNRSAKA